MHILSLGHKDLMEEEMTIHSSILAWKIPWTEESGGLQSAATAAAKLLQSCPTLRPQRRQPTRLPRPWDSPGKNTGVGCHFLLQGIFLTQGSNPGLLHWRQMLYPLSH